MCSLSARPNFVVVNFFFSSASNYTFEETAHGNKNWTRQHHPQTRGSAEMQRKPGHHHPGLDDVWFRPRLHPGQKSDENLVGPTTSHLACQDNQPSSSVKPHDLRVRCLQTSDTTLSQDLMDAGGVAVNTSRHPLLLE